MGTVNINTLQNLTYNGSVSELLSYSDIYFKQSLANLGQRFGVKGDGTSINQFSLYELVPGCIIPDSSSFNEGGNLYGAYFDTTIKKKENDGENNNDSGDTTWSPDNSYTITVTAYMGNGEEEYYQVSQEFDYSSCYIIDGDTAVTGPKTSSVGYISDGNNIISKYSYACVVNNNSIHTLSIATKEANVNGQTLDLSFNSFDTNNRRLNSGLRVYYEDNIKVDVTYIKYTNDTYSVDHWVYENDNTNNAWTLDNIWESLWNQNPDNIDPGTILTKINDILSSLTAVETTHYDDISYDKDAHQIGETGVTLINSNIEQWNNDVIYECPFWQEKYNNYMYFNDNNTLKTYLFTSIIFELYNMYTVESLDVNSGNFHVYLPYDYTFVYTCNSNNQEQIYNSVRDITVESCNNPAEQVARLIKNGYGSGREQIMITNSSSRVDENEDIFSIWRYGVSYVNNIFVDNIFINRFYVMPYVNSDGYWNINNIDTNIYACGKNGGTPSTIIIYTNGVISGTIDKPLILSQRFQEELNELKWGYKEYKVRPLDSDNVTEYHLMTTLMPIDLEKEYIHGDIIEFLENAMIMTISSVDDENTQGSKGVPMALSDHTQLGKGAVITTFWGMTKQSQGGTVKYDFEYVKQPNTDWAIDFNYLTDAKAVIQHYMNDGMTPDVYEHSWLVYDAVSGHLKNYDQYSDLDQAYPVVMNIHTSGLNDMFDIEHTSADNGRYTNNLNIVPYFTNNVVFQGSYIADVQPNNTTFEQQTDIDGKTVNVPLTFFGFEEKNNTYVVDVVRQLRDDPNKLNDGETNINDVLSYDYHPNTRIFSSDGSYSLLPTFDFKEVFVRDINTLNRYNILTPNAAGQIHYSYIGGAFDDPNRNIVHIGTGTEDINLGLQTLTNIENRRRFIKNDEIDIDFDSIALNGNVITPRGVWTTSSYDGITLYSTEYTPVYIGNLHTVSSLEEATSHYMTSMPQTVGHDTQLNDTTTVNAYTTYLPIINLTYLINNVFNFKPEYLSIYTDPTISKQIDNTYLMRMSTYPALSVTYVNAASTYAYIFNPINISYYKSDDTYNFTINETITTMSTVYALYDGGDI